MQNIIFTDGSSRGNPGSGGWGAVVVSARSDLAEVIELGGREENTTNNRMELTAVINGLANIEVDAEYIVYTDSSYLINGITKWVFGWQKNGWKTKTKDDVLNKDLWIALLEKSKNKKVSYKYVGGHVGIVGNERCDVIATSFADNKKIELYRGPLSNYPVKNIEDVSQNLEKVEDKKTTRSRSNAKAYSYISAVGGVVEKHASWADCEKRVKGAKGARYKKALNREEEAEIMREFSR
jgi:ribonuclease HI